MMKTTIIAILSILSALFFVTACSENPDPDENSTGGAISTIGPLLGKADGIDGADYFCRVVLRDVGRRSNGTGGYLDNGREWIWFGSIDVAGDIIAQGAIPALIYRVSGRDWYEVSTVAVPGGLPGFQRYAFEISEGLIGPGMSGTSLTRSVIELIPFLHQEGMGRLFDHNYHTNEWDNYLLNIDNFWTYQSEGHVCPTPLPPEETPTNPLEELAVEARPAAFFNFTEDRRLESSGKLVAGGTVEIEYALSRLPECRSTDNGHPSWNIRAHVLFSPGGQQAEADLREFENNQAQSTGTVFSVPAIFNVPEDANSMEIWFHNYSMSELNPCEGWDSNNGANYRFNVLPQPEWMGNVAVKITRTSGHPCDGGVWLGDTFEYGDWPRVRAITRNVCFETYQPGITDRHNPDLWQELDVRVHWRFDDGDFSSKWLDLVDQPGNNARYAFNVGAMDPFRFYHCPDVPYVERENSWGGFDVVATMEFFFTVNGAPLYSETDSMVFRGVYWDHKESWFREEHCP